MKGTPIKLHGTIIEEEGDIITVEISFAKDNARVELSKRAILNNQLTLLDSTLGKAPIQSDKEVR